VFAVDNGVYTADTWCVLVISNSEYRQCVVCIVNCSELPPLYVSFLQGQLMVVKIILFYSS
jgi:hypothetical protein